VANFPNSPRPLKGKLVLMNSVTSAVQATVELEINPDTLRRTLQAQGVGEERGDRLEALRLRAPAVETINLEADIDAADRLGQPDEGQNRIATQLGIYPQLAALETIVYPTSTQLQASNDLAQSGTLEIAPAEAPLTLFSWGDRRVLPVRLTDFSIDEQFFDPQLNPIRARVTLGMRVLSVDDLGFASKGGSLFMVHQLQKERQAAIGRRAAASTPAVGAAP
jgi:hypothetical protein